MQINNRKILIYCISTIIILFSDFPAFSEDSPVEFNTHNSSPISETSSLSDLETKVKDLTESLNNQTSDAGNPEILAARIAEIALLNKQISVLRKLAGQNVDPEDEPAESNSNNLPSLSDLETKVKDLTESLNNQTSDAGNPEILAARIAEIALLNKQLVSLKKLASKEVRTVALEEISPLLISSVILDLEDQIKELDRKINSTESGKLSTEIKSAYLKLKTALTLELKKSQKILRSAEKNSAKIDRNLAILEDFTRIKNVKQTEVDSVIKYAVKLRLPSTSAYVIVSASKPNKKKIIQNLKTDKNGNLLIRNKTSLQGYNLTITLSNKKKLKTKIV